MKIGAERPMAIARCANDDDDARARDRARGAAFVFIKL